MRCWFSQAAASSAEVRAARSTKEQLAFRSPATTVAWRSFAGVASAAIVVGAGLIGSQFMRQP